MMRALRPIYPYLAIIYPILAMVSEHHADLYWKEVLLAMGGVIVMIAIAELLFFTFIKDTHRRAMLLGIIALLFWITMPLLDMARDNLNAGVAAKLSVAGVTALFIAGTIFWLYKKKPALSRFSVFANIMSLCIVSVALLQTGYNLMTAEDFEPQPATHSNAPPPENAPDIIILIADMYGRHDMIQRYFDFNNAPFLEALRERGFYVADRAWANYNFTRSAVPSVLNYQYLDGLAPVHGGNIPYSTLIEENRMASYLRERGYEFTAFASGTGLSEIRSADHYLAPPNTISEFGNLLITRTPLRFVVNRIRAYKQKTLDARYLQYDQHRNRILFTFEGLKNFQRREKPQFVFAHVLLPHDPFVLDAQRNPIYPETRYVLAAYPKWENPNPEEYYTGYRNHLQAFNTLALEAIDAIQERYPDTIILLQGDHGPRSNKLEEYHGRGWQTYVHEEMGILNALYLPGIDVEEILYPEISPVNSFRVVLNEYFGEDLPLLEDRAWFVQWHEDKVHEVTERLQQPVESSP